MNERQGARQIGNLSLRVDLSPSARGVPPEERYGFLLVCERCERPFRCFRATEPFCGCCRPSEGGGMTLDEKIMLVATYGDISEFNRNRWFKFEAAPGLVEKIARINGIIGTLNDGRALIRKGLSLG